jgi:RNA-binding protein
LSLNGKQRRALRALGHHLDPVVNVGKEGVSESLLAALEQALDDHELIKVKVGESSPLDRHEAAEALSSATHSEVAQILGRTILLFRRNPEKPRIEVPGMPMPKVEKKPESEEAPHGKPGAARAKKPDAGSEG